jgi:hypothetical protein
MDLVEMHAKIGDSHRKRDATTVNATISVFSDNIIGVQVPAISPPANKVGVRYTKIEVANDGKTFGQALDLVIVDTKCQILVNNTYVLKV